MYMSDFDINIKRVVQKQDPYKGSELQLIFEGTDVDSCICNTLRHLVFTEIPIYAVSKSTIDI
jgi:hypothetical protein